MQQETRMMYRINFKTTKKSRKTLSWTVFMANSSAVISYLKDKLALEGYDNPKILNVECLGCLAGKVKEGA